MDILIPAGGDVTDADALIETLRSHSGVPFSATHAPHRNLGGLFAYTAEYRDRRAILHIPGVPADDDALLTEERGFIRFLCFMDGSPVRWIYLTQRIRGWCRTRRPTLVGTAPAD